MTTKETINGQYFPKINDSVDRVLLWRKCQVVKRFHALPVIRNQRIDEHSFGAMAIAVFLDPEVSANTMKAIMFHDHAEFFTGDIPAPAKHMNPALRLQLQSVENDIDKYLCSDYELDSRGQMTLKLADALEGLLYCFEERMLGNRNVDVVFGTYALFVRDLTADADGPVVQRAVALARVVMRKFTDEAGGSLSVPINLFEV